MSNIYLLLLFSFNIVLSQNNELSEVLDSGLNVQEKIRLADSLISKHNFSVKNRLLGYKKYRRWLYKNKKVNKTIAVLKEEIFFTKKNVKDSICYIQSKYSTLAYYLFKANKFSQVISSIKDSKITFNNDCKSTVNICVFLAKCHRKLGEYSKAISYYNYVIKSGVNVTPKKMVSYYINISQSYILLGGYDNIKQGRSYLLRADSILSLKTINYKINLAVYSALGESYNFKETLNLEKGLYYFNKGVDLAKKNNDSLSINTFLYRKGNLYNTIILDSAIFYQKKSLRYLPKKNRIFALYNYGNLAYCYSQTKEYKKSNEYYQRVFKLLTGFPIKELCLDKAIIYSSAYRKELFTSLLDYSSLLYDQYSSTKDIEHLKDILSIYSLAEDLIELIRINSSELNSKLHWRKQANELYGNAVKSCYALNNKEKAFYFMEKNKALILLEDLHYQKMKTQADLPNEIITQEKELLTAVYVLKKRLNENNNDLENQNTLFKKKLALEKLQDSIGELLPNTLELRTGLITTLKQVQKKCKTDEAVLEYIIHDNFGYGLLIEKEKSCLFELKTINDLKSNIAQIRDKISNPFYAKSDFKDYNLVAFETYQQLLPTKEIQTIINNKRTTIIPDSFLSFLPFEALVSNGNTNTFLIESAEISYGLSYSFLHENFKKDRIEPSMVAFAPEYFKNNQLTVLTNSIHEVTAINKSIASLTFENEKATKENFIKELPKHSIIHLATHADAYDSITPWIAFQDKKLSLEELYLTKNNADLVVLSACKTNNGALAEGEGVMSLSRGFFQTGAKSVIASLWNVDDKATSNIIIDFYKNLKKQQSKPEALRNAKLSYLKKSSLSDSSPYYWAPFIVLGESEAIAIPEKQTWYYWVGGVFIFLFIILFFKRFKG